MMSEGTRVRVLERPARGHVRVPRYVRGREGVVTECVGSFLNPEQLAFGDSSGPAIPVYIVRFLQRTLWRDYAGNPGDTLQIELPEHWLTEVLKDE